MSISLLKITELIDFVSHDEAAQKGKLGIHQWDFKLVEISSLNLLIVSNTSNRDKQD